MQIDVFLFIKLSLSNFLVLSYNLEFKFLILFFNVNGYTYVKREYEEVI